MVKNSGGSKTKGIARKSFTPGKTSHVRLPTSNMEIIAAITKSFGNGRVETCNINNVTLQAVIRNKFRGRGKQNNTISVGTFVINQRICIFTMEN